MAIRGACAAEGDASDRLLQRRLARPLCAVRGRGLARTEGNWLYRGPNLAIEYRWAEGYYDRLPELAADLVGCKVNLIVAAGDEPALAAKSATSTIPIVFIIGADPVASGLITSLARPGGTRTGISLMFAELTL